MRRRAFRIRHLLPLALLAAPTGPAHAGPSFFAGRWQDGRFVPGDGVQTPCFSVRYSTTTAEVADGWVQSRTEERIAGPEQGHVDTVGVLSEGTLSGAWQLNETDGDAFALAENLLFYATDLGILRARFASVLPPTEPAPARNTKVRVARLRHGEQGAHPRDWDAAAPAWPVLGSYARHVAGVEVEERAPVALGDDLEGIDLLHLTGRRALRLSAAERRALKAWVEAGGTLLVDARTGSEAFAASARREISSLFGALSPLAAGEELADGRFEGGADLGRGIRLELEARRHLRGLGRPDRGQHLEVIRLKGRPAVVFSGLDLGAGLAGVEVFRARGYRPESARRIATNLLAWLAAGR